MKNQFNSATPEQKFYILTAELKGPIDTIRGYAYIIKKSIESNNINPEDLLKLIDKIAETADKMKELRDELVKSQ